MLTKSQTLAAIDAKWRELNTHSALVGSPDDDAHNLARHVYECLRRAVDSLPDVPGEQLDGLFAPDSLEGRAVEASLRALHAAHERALRSVETVTAHFHQAIGRTVERAVHVEQPVDLDELDERVAERLSKLGTVHEQIAVTRRRLVETERRLLEVRAELAEAERAEAEAKGKGVDHG